MGGRLVMTELRPYAPPSFWTTQGAWAKRRQLERKGFPTDLRGWRFVTLTLDPKKYSDPCIGWLLGKRHLRKFVYALRKKYGIMRWCWKMEFHEADEDGRIYPHWHLLFDYKQKIDKDELAKLWGKGRTNIKRVDKEDFEYIFKYATKALENIPQWILDRTNVRLFQTSKGFFPTLSASGVTEKVEAKPSPRPCDLDRVTETQNSRIIDETIGERLQRWSRYVVSRSLSQDGKVRHFVRQMTCNSWGSLLVSLSRVKIQNAITQMDLEIRENVIKTSCLISMERFLPGST